MEPGDDAVLHKCLFAGHRTVHLQSSQHQLYEIDFTRMLQTNLATGRARRIRQVSRPCSQPTPALTRLPAQPQPFRVAASGQAVRTVLPPPPSYAPQQTYAAAPS